MSSKSKSVHKRFPQNYTTPVPTKEMLQNLAKSELMTNMFNNQRVIMEVARAASLIAQSLCKALKDKIDLDIEPYLKEELENYRQTQLVQKKMAEAKAKAEIHSSTDPTPHHEQNAETQSS